LYVGEASALAHPLELGEQVPIFPEERCQRRKITRVPPLAKEIMIY
jgi:hypothetical protein